MKILKFIFDKNTTASILAAALTLACLEACADYRHPYRGHVESAVSTGSTNPDGTALSIATSQHNFHYGTSKWQMSAGLGFYDDVGALSIGLGKNFDGVMVNFSLGGTDANKYGGGAGVTWIVK